MSDFLDLFKSVFIFLLSALICAAYIIGVVVFMGDVAFPLLTSWPSVFSAPLLILAGVALIAWGLALTYYTIDKWA